MRKIISSVIGLLFMGSVCHALAAMDERIYSVRVAGDPVASATCLFQSNGKDVQMRVALPGASSITVDAITELSPCSLSGGTMFTVATAGTAVGCLLSVMKGSITTVREIRVTCIGMTTTATGRAGIGTAPSIASGVGAPFACYFPANLENMSLTALTTTSIYVQCSDSNVTAIVHLLGK